MQASILKQTIKTMLYMEHPRTICIEGAPGGGKTQIVEQVAREENVPCITLHLPTMLVEDFGILFPNGDDKLHYKLPEWFPDAADPNTPEKGILLFDDRNQAGGDLQKVLANICQARTLHGHKLPDGWMVISTGNRKSDRAGSVQVLSHLRDRENVLEYDANLDDWCSWASDNGVLVEGVSFMRMRPDLLHQFDPKQEISPTPRSWTEGVFQLLNVVPAGTEYEVFKGAVGEGAAAEFTAFLKIYRNLPDLDNIVKNPATADVPTDPSTLYALAGALARKATEKTFGAIIEYLGRVPSGDIAVLCVSYAVRQDNKLTQTKAFIDWAVKNQELLF